MLGAYDFLVNLVIILRKCNVLVTCTFCRVGVSTSNDVILGAKVVLPRSLWVGRPMCCVLATCSFIGLLGEGLSYLAHNGILPKMFIIMTFWRSLWVSGSGSWMVESFVEGFVTSNHRLDDSPMALLCIRHFVLPKVIFGFEPSFGW